LISASVMGIVLLMIPGIVTNKIVKKLVGDYEEETWESLVSIFTYSIINYTIFGLIYNLFNDNKLELSKMLTQLAEGSLVTDLKQLALVTLLGIIIAYIIALVSNKKYINRFGQFLKVTKRYGEEDVWNRFHNTNFNDWMIVRDHKLELYYSCIINTFSDNTGLRELILLEVMVYNSRGDFLYETPVMYIGRETNELTIEIFVDEEGENDG